jgi:hypothetical protein
MSADYRDNRLYIVKFIASKVHRSADTVGFKAAKTGPTDWYYYMALNSTCSKLFFLNTMAQIHGPCTINPGSVYRKTKQHSQLQ